MHKKEMITLAGSMVKGGEKPKDVYKKLGIPQATFYRWSKKYRWLEGFTPFDQAEARLTRLLDKKGFLTKNERAEVETLSNIVVKLSGVY